MQAPTITIPISPGELIDKITILEIKHARFTDAVKLANVDRELALLSEICAEHVASSTELEGLRQRLKAVNEVLWELEERIRAYEKQEDFGPPFIETARSIYRSNDERAALKYAINQVLGSPLFEEKSY